MSNITFEQTNENSFYLRNVPIVYSRVNMWKEIESENNGVKKKEKKYEVTAIIPEDIADEVDAADFAKPETKKILIKKGDKSFEERYHMDRPDWVAEAKHWQVVFRQKAEYKDKQTGEMKEWDYGMDARPKVMMVDPDSKSNQLIDITNKFLGNGTIADIFITTYDTQNGKMARLAGVFVKELVEGETKEYAPLNPWEEYGAAPVPSFDEGDPKEEPKRATSNAEAPQTEPDFDDAPPF